jgi:hypothetical protein
LEAWRSEPQLAATTGLHTAALTPEGVSTLSTAEHPQGDGYAIVKSSLTGSITWTGRLSDGTALTGAATRGPDGQVPLHAMLYSNTGSIQGWSQMSSPNNHIDGLMQWVKSPQPLTSRTRSYKAGFPHHTLTLTGDKFVKPALGQTILNSAPAPLNAQLSFAGASLSQSFAQPLTLTGAHTAQIPAHEVQLKISAINITTGLFSGTFTLSDFDPMDASPPVAILQRQASFNGVLVHRLGRGVGHFLLPRLPEAVGQSLSTSAIQSGRVSLEPMASGPQ